jgi:hypothetical protein
MSDLVHLSAGAHRALAHGDNIVDLDAQRRARLRAEFGTDTPVRSRKRAGRPSVDTARVQVRPTLGRDGPDAA